MLLLFFIYNLLLSALLTKNVRLVFSERLRLVACELRTLLAAEVVSSLLNEDRVARPLNRRDILKLKGSKRIIIIVKVFLNRHISLG